MLKTPSSPAPALSSPSRFPNAYRHLAPDHLLSDSSHYDFSSLDPYFALPDLSEDFDLASPSVGTEKSSPSTFTTEGDNNTPTPSTASTTSSTTTPPPSSSALAASLFAFDFVDIDQLLCSDFTLFPESPPHDGGAALLPSPSPASTTAAPTPATPVTVTASATSCSPGAAPELGDPLVSVCHGSAPSTSHPAIGMSSTHSQSHHHHPQHIPHTPTTTPTHTINTPPSPSSSSNTTPSTIPLHTPTLDAATPALSFDPSDLSASLSRPLTPLAPRGNPSRVRKRSGTSARRSKRSRSPSEDLDGSEDGRQLPDIVIVDKNDPVAVKRARNTLAARRYRQKKMDRMAELEEMLEEAERERDEARREAEHYRHEAEKYQMLFHVVQRNNGGK